MKIILKDKRVGQGLNQASQQKQNARYGSWGVVTDVNSVLNAVTVKLSSGVELKDVPVACFDEWVCENNDKNYVSGSRNLPPQGSRVFLFMPTATFEGAFVLCSGLSMYEKEHRKKFMALSEADRNKKNDEREKVFLGNWKSNYNYKTGSYELISPNENIKLTIKDDTGQQEITIKAFASELKIDKEGNIALKAANGKKISLNGDSFSGLVKADELKTELDKMTVRIDGIINALKTAAVTPQDGGAAFKTNIVSALTTLVNKENFSNIKNTNVVHGG
ncbi:hypothetical protein [Treponema pedis]|uniref:hypothetical protein n=1 Tax=Treponema pedis TaxID=409322 RepID=UPI003D246ABF